MGYSRMTRPHRYGSRTLRRLSPLHRRVAIEVNNIKTTAARLRKVVDELGRYEEAMTAATAIRS